MQEWVVLTKIYLCRVLVGDVVFMETGDTVVVHAEQGNGGYGDNGQEISEGNCGVLKCSKNPTIFLMISALIRV